MAENNEGVAVTRELASRVGELTQAMTSGFNYLVNALSQCAAAHSCLGVDILAFAGWIHGSERHLCLEEGI